ncbi:MAG TPA: IS1595 family transposase [Verrucomicrobiae bacterium]|jgi:transposase-like protein
MKTQPEFDADDLNLVSLAQEYSDEDKARELLEQMFWPNGAVCPHCKNDGKTKPNSKMTPKPDSKHPIRKGVYFCGACRKLFSVTVGTIFERSHVPINKWLLAWFIMSSSKKSVSAHQLHRMLKVTYKTAWFMCHRIRFGVGADLQTAKPLDNVCEADETFVNTGKQTSKFKRSKFATVALVLERDGEARTRVIPSVTMRNVGKFLNETVSKKAVVNTDEHASYTYILKPYKRHERVNHSKYEYARKNPNGTMSHINTCESFFSLVKRGMYGAFHCVSREHLPKYMNEFEYRWNTRKLTDGARMAAGIPMTQGKRLMYRQPVN